MGSRAIGEALQQAHDVVADMIKQSANEPSVGLYFVQQHVRKAVPAVISLKDQVHEGAHEAELSTADAKDAISAVKVMKSVGPSAVENMIQQLNLSIESLQRSRRATEFPRSKKPGLQRSSSSTTKHSESSYARNIWDSALDKATNITRRSSSPVVDHSQKGDVPEVIPLSTSPYGYVRSVFESASQRVGSLGWSDSTASAVSTTSPDSLGNGGSSSSLAHSKPVQYVRAVTTLLRTNKGAAAAVAEETHNLDEEPEVVATENLTLDSKAYDRFQAENEAKLAEWLDKP